MPRPLRVEYKGARYHVMCRGSRNGGVFRSQQDADLFLKTLSEAVQRSDLVIHAYVLMRTHYHLLLETPSGNLVEGMKWLQGAFSQRMNAMHKTWGHLFQGRYKAKVIDQNAPEYFRKVSEYIHLNPAATGLVPSKPEFDLKAYSWSSFAHYTKPPSKRPEWLTTDFVLGHYHLTDSIKGRRQYGELMNDLARRVSRKKKAFFKKENAGMERGWIHGSKEFRKEMLDLLEEGEGASKNVYDKEQGRDLSEQAVLRDIQRGCGFLGIEYNELPRMKTSCPEKMLLAAWIKENYSLTNARISELLTMGHPTFISRCRPMVLEDSGKRAQYEALKSELYS